MKTKTKLVDIFRRAISEKLCVACKDYYKVGQKHACGMCWQAKLNFVQVKNPQAFRERLISNTQDENWLEEFAQTLR